MADINTVLNDETWVERSLPAEDLTPEFSFVLSRTVYVGDPNSVEQLQSDVYNPPIAVPELAARDPLRPSAREVIDQESKLAAYYLEMIDRTGRKPDAYAVGYWLRLEFVSEALDQQIGFPWWDRVAEASSLFDWARTTDSGGEEFFDCDQGWFFRAGRMGQELHFQQGDLDTGDVYANLKVGRSGFLGRLDQAERDIGTVIERLGERLQIDPWS